MKHFRIHQKSALAGAAIVLGASVLVGMQTRIKVTPLPIVTQDQDWNFWSNPPHQYSIPGGNVGIGTSTPTTPLEVRGLVFSNLGGFQFPDGTIQTTAATPTVYAKCFTVAQSGGDFTTITAAMAACTSPGPTNRYLVRVMPGTYAENIACQSYVTLQGAGKYATELQGTILGADDSTVSGFYIAAGVRCFGTSPTLTNNIITNEGEGIWITASGRPLIKENEIRDCGLWGIHCDGWGTDAWIIANKIERNAPGGILCTNSSPTISNNQILENQAYGIYLIGALGEPSEPTIDDNVIGRTDEDGSGVGIYMTSYAEPRIISNDIWVNFTGIEIHPFTQPSIQGNNLNYNHGYGIRCFSSGATKRVMIKGNYIHSNWLVGIDVFNADPLITHNDILYSGASDISYAGPPFPMISMNIYDSVFPGGLAAGALNLMSSGAAIGP